jgi:hypothetical protein
MTNITSDQVWNEIGKNLFAVLGMVTARHEARTVGIIYIVRNRKLYIGTGKDSWKARHIAQNGHVSLTVPIAKRIPLLPWIKIPAATITFAGEAKVIPGAQADPELLTAVFKQVAEDRSEVEKSCIIEVTPQGDFVTYGVGVSLMEMRHPDKARARVAVNAA